MKKTPLIILAIFFAVVIVVVIIWQVKSISGSSAQAQKIEVSSAISHVFVSNCARCHGNSGQGSADTPALVNSGYSADAVKQVILHGGEKMPAFTNFDEKTLNELAKYVSLL